MVVAWALAPQADGQSATAVSVPYRVAATGAGNSYAPLFSADGRHVAFVSHANNLVTNDDLGPHLDLFVRDLAASNTVLVSVNKDGFGGANANISLFALSSNGQVVAFETIASNLTAGDTNGLADIFVRDLAAGATALVSVNADGNGPGNGRSYNPQISADGRYVVFESLASNLVTNDFNGTNDVFVRDLAAGTTTLISLNSDGTASGDGPSHSPSISANGLVVAYVSSATNIVTGVTNRAGEIYVRDMTAGGTKWAMASHVSGTYDPLTRFYSAFQPTMSADGRFVVFKTQRGSLVRFDTSRSTNRIVLAFPGAPMITDSNFFVFQDNPRLVGPITTPGPGGTTSGGFGDGALVFNTDGRYAAFTTGTNAPGLQQSVLRADFEEFTTNSLLFCCDGTSTFFYITSQVPVLTVVSTNFGIPHFVPPLSLAPAMSDDARRILFLSDGANASGMSSGTVFRVYLRDMDTNVLYLVSTNRSGAAGSVVSDTLPALSADGTLMAWESADPNLVLDDLNGAFDIFVRNLTTGETTLISAAHPGLPAATGLGLASTGPGSFSADGTRLGFASLDSNQALEDTNAWRDGFLRDRLSGTNFFVSGISFPVSFPTGALTNEYLAANQATVPQLSADGRYALFDGLRTTLSLVSSNHILVWRDLLGGTSVIVAESDSASRFALGPSGLSVFFHSALPTGQHGVMGIADNNSASDIFAWNASGPPSEPRIRVLSASRLGASTANAGSVNPVLSPDGCRLAFLSRASDLTADSAGNPAYQVFVREGLCHPTNSFLGTNRLVSYRTTASLAPDGRSLDQPWPTGGANPVFSANNRYVFFNDGASNVIYRHDLQAPDIVTITVPMPAMRFTNIARVTNLTVCTGCLNPSPSADGRFVAYEVPGTNGLTNIVLKDIVSGSTELMSVNLAGTGGGNGPSFMPLQSYDGRFVFFASKAADLVANDTNRATDIFVRDRWAGVTHCLSMNRFGTATGNRVSSQPVLSPDGRTVAFQSFATDLVPGDYNDTRDVFVVALGGSDTDGDGLDDDWEVAYFNDLSRDGAGDFDGDGASDSSEFRAGTDPTNSGSVFRVISLTTYIAPSAQQTTTLLWAATPGRLYRVQTKPDDLSGPWTDLPGDVVATSTSAAKFHITTAGSSSRSFYRVQLVQ
jgi:Tol biopolymer transport system component